VGFSGVLDQSIPVRLLRNIIRLRRIPNGLLFWGPEGVGKRFTALEFAKAVNCNEAEADNCGHCLSCQKIDHDNHPDVKIIRPGGKTRIIKVQTVEQIIELTAYRPFEGKRRVILLEDIERMNVQAQNYFLKTLEEPPSETTFVLITSAPSMLLPTIRSRCQKVRFGALRPESVAQILLSKRDLPPTVATAIAALSQGQVSRACDLVDSEKREVVLSITHRLHEGDDPLQLGEEFAGHMKSRMSSFQDMLSAQHAAEREEGMDEDREEAKEAIEAAAAGMARREMMEYFYLLQTWYRDGMVYASTHNPGRLLNQDQVDRLQAEAARASAEKLEAIGKAWVYIERNLNMERVFRDLFIKLAA
jgi:DNA polymerase-3 subunit delta'